MLSDGEISRPSLKKGTARLSALPNRCLYQDGGSFTISAVTVTDSFGNKFQFENLTVNPEIEPSGRHWRIANLYTPSWNWNDTANAAASEEKMPDDDLN